MLPASFIAIIYVFSISTKSDVFFYFEYAWFMLCFRYCLWRKKEKVFVIIMLYFVLLVIVLFVDCDYPLVSSNLFSNNLQAQFEDAKLVIRIRKSKTNRQHNGKRKSAKGQTTIYKTLHRKLKIEEHEPTKSSTLNTCAPEG